MLKMKSVILAGGSGTRLRPLTFTRPKPMLPLVNKPIIHHIVNYLKNSGINDIAITTNYLRKYISDYFGDGKNYGINPFYSVEPMPLGTAGSVKNIESYLDQTFVVIQGDNITDINLNKLIKCHRECGGLCTIAMLPVKDPWHYGVAELGDSGIINKFHEKPSKDECFSNLINTGIYIIEPEALEFVPKNEQFDFSRDLFPILQEKDTIYGCPVDPTDTFWVDIGQIEGYAQAVGWMFDNMGGDVFIGENVEINANVNIIEPVVIGNNTVIENNCTLTRTSLGEGSIVKRDSNLDNSTIFENTSIGKGSMLKNSLIAEDCATGPRLKVQPNAVIGPNCRMGSRVLISNDSRIWPNIQIESNSIVDGTIRRFIQMQGTEIQVQNSRNTSIFDKVPSEEAFYFNTCKGNRVYYTGFRAENLLQFYLVLGVVEPESLNYHLRDNVNDFRDWVREILKDAKLAEDFNGIKSEIPALNDFTLKDMRRKVMECVGCRLHEIIETN